MSLPKAVQEIEDQTEAIKEAFIAEAEAKENAPKEDVVAIEPEKVEETAPAEESEPKTQEVEVEKPADDGIQSEESEQEPAQEPVNKEDTVEHWKQKFKTLQGIQNAENGRHKEEISSLSEQVKALTDKVDSSVAQVDDYVEPEQFFSDKDLETFDQDTLNLIERSINKGVNESENKKIQELEQKLEAFESKSEKDSAEIREDRTWQELERLSPGAMEINTTLEFEEWLKNTTVRFSGETMMSMASKALGSGDAKILAEVFDEYKETHGLKNEPKQKSPTSKHAEPHRGGESTHEDIVREKPTYTEAQIARFNADCINGVYFNREAEAEQIDNQIKEAIMEGRVK